MRQIFRTTQPAPTAANEGRSPVDSAAQPAAAHPEPIGHVHDAYRHWVWLGLQHRQAH